VVEEEVLELEPPVEPDPEVVGFPEELVGVEDVEELFGSKTMVVTTMAVPTTTMEAMMMSDKRRGDMVRVWLFMLTEFCF
jgi:hypothetical protein